MRLFRFGSLLSIEEARPAPRWGIDARLGFDRLLAAQALERGFALVTHDELAGLDRLRSGEQRDSLVGALEGG